nr:rRNA large subunit methyltransferase I [bacterium]
PPAFCKNRAAQQNAMRGYKEINLRALKLLAPGGTLITCSCSHYMYPELFWRMLRMAAADSGRQVRVLETPMQPADHPVRLAFDESHYLKCIVAQVD